MKRVLVWLCLCLTFVLALHAEAQESGDADPAWLERPSGESLADKYPLTALVQGVNGRVQLICTVALDTRSNCSIVSETPTGWGFGAAALEISQTFRFRPARRNGAAVVGGRVSVALPFRLRDSESFLPRWDDAPSYEDVQAARPAAAREANVVGTGVLSCEVMQDRRLNCGVLVESPVGYGFGRAALSLASKFQVAEEWRGDKNQALVLPIAFGAEADETPICIFCYYRFAGRIYEYDVPASATLEYMPARARASHVTGTAIVVCGLVPDSRIACAVESETPAGYGFGDAALTLLRTQMNQTLGAHRVMQSPVNAREFTAATRTTVQFGEAPEP
jgi:hypothetical protein